MSVQSVYQKYMHTHFRAIKQRGLLILKITGRHGVKMNVMCIIRNILGQKISSLAPCLHFSKLSVLRKLLERPSIP